MGFLLALLWSAPPIELALADVAREMRCLPESSPIFIAWHSAPCALCSIPVSPGELCAGCVTRLFESIPEVCA